VDSSFQNEGKHKLVKHPEPSVSKLQLVKVWNILT